MSDKRHSYLMYICSEKLYVIGILEMEKDLIIQIIIANNIYWIKDYNLVFVDQILSFAALAVAF